VRPAAATGGLRQGGRRGGGCAWWRVRRGGLQVVGEVAMSSRAAGLAGVGLKLYCHRTGREHLRMGLLRFSESSVRRRPLFTYKRRLDERSETDAADCNHSGWQITGADTVEWRLLQVTARNSVRGGICSNCFHANFEAQGGSPVDIVEQPSTSSNGECTTNRMYPPY
jgi:hypothetical protein